MTGRVVMVAYKPKAGEEARLKELLRTHVVRLREEGLATLREPIIVESASGYYVEVFEWQSSAAIEAAHSNPAVGQMWQEFAAVCDFVPAAEVPEMANLFSEFSPVHI